MSGGCKSWTSVWGDVRHGQCVGGGMYVMDQCVWGGVRHGPVCGGCTSWTSVSGGVRHGPVCLGVDVMDQCTGVCVMGQFVFG